MLAGAARHTESAITTLRCGRAIGGVAAILVAGSGTRRARRRRQSAAARSTYMIPADAPPSLDGHRETTYATLHPTAPFYSVLIRVNPDNPASTTDFVCDLCTEMPKPTDDGKTYTFKIRDGVKFHDGSPLDRGRCRGKLAGDRLSRPMASLSAARANFMMVDKIEAPDATTVVFKLKFATSAFLPALADPYGFIYAKEILEKDPHWYEKNIMGSGPFKFAGVRDRPVDQGRAQPRLLRPGPALSRRLHGIFAPKQATRVDAIRADRAAIEFRGLPPSARDQLVKELGDKITVQDSDWNCGNVLTPNQKEKPFDDVRVRRALILAIDQWNGAPALSKIADRADRRRHRVPGLAAGGRPRRSCSRSPGFWPDIEKSRAEARRLLKEAGAEGLTFEMLNRNVDQPYKYRRHLAGRRMEQDRRQGHAEDRADRPVARGDARRRFRRRPGGQLPERRQPDRSTCGRYLPPRSSSENYAYYEDPKQIELYNTMLHETDPAKAARCDARVREAGDRYQAHTDC